MRPIIWIVQLIDWLMLIWGVEGEWILIPQPISPQYLNFSHLKKLCSEYTDSSLLIDKLQRDLDDSSQNTHEVTGSALQRAGLALVATSFCLQGVVTPPDMAFPISSNFCWGADQDILLYFKVNRKCSLASSVLTAILNVALAQVPELMLWPSCSVNLLTVLCKMSPHPPGILRHLPKCASYVSICTESHHHYVASALVFVFPGAHLGPHLPTHFPSAHLCVRGTRQASPQTSVWSAQALGFTQKKGGSSSELEFWAVFCHLGPREKNAWTWAFPWSPASGLELDWIASNSSRS